MKAVLGLGTNLGDREGNLAEAIGALEKLPRTRMTHMSNVYETAPFDVPSPQGEYLNCCVAIETKLPPEELLDKCLAIEAKLGRVRAEYHGARTIDIDLLLYEGFESHTQRLAVPHPGIRQRAFVLVPLSDLFPGCKADAFGFGFEEDYQAVDKSGIKLYK